MTEKTIQKLKGFSDLVKGLFYVGGIIVAMFLGWKATDSKADLALSEIAELKLEHEEFEREHSEFKDEVRVELKALNYGMATLLERTKGMD